MKSPLHIFGAFAVWATLTALAQAEESPWQQPQFARGSEGVYKMRIEPHWSEDENHFWYRNDLAGGRREFVLVDAVQGERKTAFDHERLAKAISEAVGSEVSADRLPLEGLEFDLGKQELEFRARGARWRCNLENYELKKIEPDAAGGENSRRPDVPRRSTRTGAEMTMTFVNQTAGEVELFWLDAEGREHSYGTVAAGEKKEQHTYEGHVWEVRDSEGRTLGRFEANEASAEAAINEDSPQAPPRPGSFGFRRRASDVSPDGKWTAFVRDYNVFIRSAEEGAAEIQLSRDGKEGLAFDLFEWSPDSTVLVAFRVEPGERKEVYLVESSPQDGGRAKLHTRAYDLPGDKFTSYELRLFNIAEQKEVPCDVEPIDFGRPRLRWRKNGHAFTYQKVDRGHQRFRLIEVNFHTSETRNLIDEKSETFIWTAHTENVDLQMINWLEKTEEIIYASERDGWRHLYLVDADEGTIKNKITQGEYVVRGIDRIDEENRQIWFRASGKNSDQDPYLIHYFRVDFDGGNLTELTEGDGNHTVQYSPDRNYLIDTYSRVDMAPVHELRRTADGKFLCQLETADISELEESGWKPPEVFSAKGRDGKTDIWGIICRPQNFDHKQNYPIVEEIYAGPQGSFVPKSFSPRERYRALNDLGFIVVKIDGMGTANRSKAFHDVCWRNLKDGGLADRILWMKAAAEKHPEMDISRVGVYGGSAGGQNAAAAVLFHPEFYKAAVANCGCHDNRMDKASWNEQWMGYPVGPWYAENSNIENAHRLQGKLFLIVGEMDSNVPPESTYRFVDALVKADKDFDFLLVPGGGHGAGGAYGQRRLQDFFVRHLLGREPLERNGTASNEMAKAVPPSEAALDLASLNKAESRIARIVSRYRADRENLTQFYTTRESPATHERMKKFYLDWHAELVDLDEGSLGEHEQQELRELKHEIDASLALLELQARRHSEIEPLVPFASTILQLVEDRRQVKKIDAQEAAETVDALVRQIENIRLQVKDRLQAEDPAEPTLSPDVLFRASRTVVELREHFQRWHGFYNGYDPAFTWWLRAPFEQADAELEKYAAFLDEASKADESIDQSNSPPATNSRPAESSLRDRGDAPDLRDLLAETPGPMQRVIEKFRAESPRGRGSRGSRPEAARASEAGEGERSEDQDRRPLYERWIAALEQLDFDSFSQSDRVDFLLVKNHLNYHLRRIESGIEPGRRERGMPADASGIAGRPIGREALLVELAHEMIPYTPEELIEIAEREYNWCRDELEKVSNEMGLGDDWRAAVEKVKSMHVPPGEQPYLIRDLAWEAIDYLREHDLVTIPPLAAETWRMQMMSPERQLVNPFFTGGESISVSFPTDAMSHEAKLQSMRGNNIPFARATVHHELIPGHNVQSYMTARHKPYRRMFSTPFWGEGWALYWEMLLYDRGFAKTPEDRVGFLVWRSHRCARIVFSLNYHLGRMTPQECIDYLTANVGFDPHNAAAEVRRSFESNYSPLYQAAYMTGGLQFRALHRELVESGRMTDRHFHDAILKENSMPVEMVRALFTGEPLTRDHTPRWRFYDLSP
jgi:dipeptidyl aminopeptidase/acylaminoacyl peptidase